MSQRQGLLRGTRAYLSGPMDFVASRAEEKMSGWRGRVGEFLQSLGVTVFDPWQKPEVRGLQEYGREDEITVTAREKWSFEEAAEGARARAECAGQFWETMHIDLRMVDVSDFVVAYCPTNIYSVGTPHEVLMARQQHKPVLFVSPPVDFPALSDLKDHLARNDDREGMDLLAELEREVPIKPNPRGIPSLWYMPLIGGEKFFDGFGFEEYRDRFGWAEAELDRREERKPPQRPLLPFLEGLNRALPKKWSLSQGRPVRDDDWLLLDIEEGDVVDGQ